MNDLAGFRIAALAVTRGNSNNYPSQTAFNTIGGIGVSGYSSYTSSYQTTSSSGPELVTSDSFSVSVSNSLVVVFAVGGGSQCQQLSGIQGLQIDANTANANPIITIGHADLASGSYTASMDASQCAAGQDPNHAGNVLGVFVFSPVGTAPSVSLLSPFYYGDCVSINGVESATTSGATIVDTSWSWGDGSVISSGFPATHTYANTGTYSVHVTATDSNGVVGSAFVNVDVTGSTALVPPELTLFSPIISGMDVTVNGVANSNACGPTQPLPAFSFNWDDGTTSIGSFLQSHTYSSSGNFGICVTATDSFGLITVQCQQATVGTPQIPLVPVSGSTFGSVESGNSWMYANPNICPANPTGCPFTAAAIQPAANFGLSNNQPFSGFVTTFGYTLSSCQQQIGRISGSLTETVTQGCFDGEISPPMGTTLSGDITIIVNWINSVLPCNNAETQPAVHFDLDIHPQVFPGLFDPPSQDCLAIFPNIPAGNIQGLFGPIFVLLTPKLNVTAHFTDSSLNRLPSDNQGNPEVFVALHNSKVKSTIPNLILDWINVTDISAGALQSFKLNETLPVDWVVPWAPPGSTVKFGPVNISISSGNPEVFSLTISNITALLGHPLMPGKSLSLPIPLIYKLIGTSQPLTSYPRTYTTFAATAAWTQASFSGTEATGTTSALFIAYGKVL